MQQARAVVALSLALSVLSPRAAASVEPATPQVVGGADIHNGMFPFVVALLKGQGVACSGSLIRPRWVLTAAHCGEPTDVLVSDARPGARGAGHDVWAIPVQSWTPHPEFDDKVFPFANDLALVELSDDAPDFPPTIDDLPLYDPAPIALATGPASTAFSIGDVLVAGFGFDDPDEKTPPPSIAQWASGVPTTGAAACDIGGLVSGRHLCYGPSPNTCTGDSGGPVFRFKGGRYEQVAVISVGAADAPCATFDDAGTYVPGYLDWIEDTISLPGSSPITLGWELPPAREDGLASGIGNGQGWTFSSAGSIESVELFIDGEKEATLPCCSERGDAPGPVLSGFAGVISWGRFSPGDHEATLVVRDSAGNQRSEARTITTVRSLPSIPFARSLSFAGASCSTTDDELACSGLQFAQQGCAGEMRFRWLDGKQALEVSQGCPG